MVLFKRINIPHGMFFTLFSLFLLISTISILGLGIFWISTGKMAIEITAKRQFAIIATRVGSEIEGIVNIPLNTLNYIATLSHTLPSKDLFKKGFLVDLTIKYPFLKRIAYIGMDGREEINTDLDGVLRDRSREPAFLTAIKGKTYISEVYINSENIPMMTIAIPIKRLGETIRVLMAQVSLKEMWDLIDGIHIGKGSRVWLVSKEDRLISYPDKKWVLKGRDMGYHPAIKALASGTHSLHYRDETGEEYLAYAHLLPNLGWKLVIERPTKEIFLSVSHLRHQAMFWGGINFLLAFAFSYWFSKRLTRPIIAVAKGAKSIANGNLEYQIDIKRKDEIGELANSFNHMAVSLKEMVHALRVAKEEAEVSKERFEELWLSIPDMVFTLDKNGNFVDLNKEVKNILGYEIEELKGRPFSTIGVECEEILNKIEKKGTIRGVEVRLKCKKMGEKIGELNLRLRRNGEKPDLILGIIRDITVKKQLENQVMEAEKLKALGEMASGVAHDFNNLLAIILGRISLIKMRGLPEKALKDIDIIEKAALDGAETVKRLQYFYKRQPMDKVPLDINKVIEEVVLTTKFQWQDEAQKEGIFIEVDTKLGDIPLILGNKSGLFEVFSNLIYNAVDAMPKGGKIFIETKKGDNSILISFSDTGIGMSKEVKSRVFEPFFTTKLKKGSGLGLSICYGIVKEHGGSIWVESEEGKGTTFFISLPLRT